MSGVTRLEPALSLWWFSGAVATSAIRTYRSRASAVRRSWASEPAGTSARASPMDAWASSMTPFSSICGESFRARPPKSNPVVPSSPVLV